MNDHTVSKIKIKFLFFISFSLIVMSELYSSAPDPISINIISPALLGNQGIKITFI